MVLTFSDGSTRKVELGYQPFFMTGDAVPAGKGGTIIAGAYFNSSGAPIMDNSVPAKVRQFFSNCPDGMSLLKLEAPKVAGVNGNTLFAVVQFEYQSMDQSGADMYGRLPSPIAVLTLAQDPATGQLSLVKYSNVDTSSVNGLWITCGASLSPWNTHLSSEEYEPDATVARTDAQFQAYSQNLFGDPNRANPYHYGPVSYTHLDVYKRQAWAWSRARSTCSATRSSTWACWPARCRTAAKPTSFPRRTC